MIHIIKSVPYGKWAVEYKDVPIIITCKFPQRKSNQLSWQYLKVSWVDNVDLFSLSVKRMYRFMWIHDNIETKSEQSRYQTFKPSFMSSWRCNHEASHCAPEQTRQAINLDHCPLQSGISLLPRRVCLNTFSARSWADRNILKPTVSREKNASNLGDKQRLSCTENYRRPGVRVCAKPCGKIKTSVKGKFAQRNESSFINMHWDLHE